MPTYADLREYFNRSDTLRSVVARAANIPIVSGYTVHAHPLWCYFYDLESEGSPRALARARDSLYAWSLHHRLSDCYDGLGGALELSNQIGYRRRDIARTIGLWNDFWDITCKAWPPPSPVVLTIVHRPLRSTEHFDDAQGGEQSLARLRAIAAESRSDIVRLEERMPARLAASAGDAIVATCTGTLGGVLRDSSGAAYGVTCAHVALKNSDVTDASGVKIGSCLFAAEPVALGPGAGCDPVNLLPPYVVPGNGPQVNQLDCALIDCLVAPTSAMTIAGVAHALTQGQRVVMDGAVTGVTRYKLGSLCLSYSFNDGVNDYCFQDTIELRPIPWIPVGGALGSIFTTVPTQGDSGAWVMTANHPSEWAGMLVGEDGDRGFAIRASWIKSWAETETGRTLSA